MKFAARTLRRSPTFSLIAILTLAIGIGASTAIFSMVHGVLLRRLPYGQGDRLIHLRQPSASAPDEGFSVLEVKDLREQTRSLAGVAEYHSMSFHLYGHGDPMRVQTGVVSDDFFDLLGVKPLLGRTFRPGEEAVGAPPVVVLSYRFWLEQFAGDPRVVGSTFTMNDRTHTVVGVLPPLPGYPDDNDIWMPAGACPFRSAPDMMNSRSMRMVSAFATRTPGVTLAQARANLATVMQRLHTQYPEAYPPAQRLSVGAVSVREELTSRARPLLLTLFATSAFLLLVATANFANLTLSRQIGRARELAVRHALGAASWRLYRQLATESLLVTLIGGVLGVWLAGRGVGMLRAVAARVSPRASEITLDPVVFLFALGVSVAVALTVAALPLLRGHRSANIADALRLGNAGSMIGRGEGRLRSALVAAQVAIAFVLLIGAGLIGKSLLELERVQTGFESSGVLTARLNLNFSKYNTSAARRNFTDALLERLSGTPGVSSVAVASALPLSDAEPANVSFQIAGISSAGDAQNPHSDVTAVSPDYFRTVGVPLLRGREFSATDRDTLAPVVIVSRRLARTYWGGRDPVGTRITADSGRHWFTVVGVVGDVRQTRLDQDITDELYLTVANETPGDLRVFLRTAGATAGPVPSVVSRLREVVRALDDKQPIVSIQTLEQVRGVQLEEPRLTTALLVSFAVLALILTATGLGGIVAYAVSQRLPEIAVRLALGASHASVLRLVVRDGVGSVVVGLVVGGALALATSRFASALLYRVAPTDAVTYLAVAAMLLMTAVTACLLPARRAQCVDPARVFRDATP